MCQSRCWTPSLLMKKGLICEEGFPKIEGIKTDWLDCWVDVCNIIFLVWRIAVASSVDDVGTDTFLRLPSVSGITMSLTVIDLFGLLLCVFLISVFLEVLISSPFSPVAGSVASFIWTDVWFSGSGSLLVEQRWLHLRVDGFCAQGAEYTPM